MEGALTPPPSEALLRALLAGARTVAVVGASPKSHRPSQSVMGFLQARGLRCYPVNPNAVGGRILGEPVFARLADLSGPVDIVDVFRKSALAASVVDAAIAEKDRLAIRAVWLQVGVRDAAAMARAAAAGLLAVQDRCLAVDYRLLLGGR